MLWPLHADTLQTYGLKRPKASIAEEKSYPTVD